MYIHIHDQATTPPLKKEHVDTRICKTTPISDDMYTDLDRHEIRCEGFRRRRRGLQIRRVFSSIKTPLARVRPAFIFSTVFYRDNVWDAMLPGCTPP